MVVRTAAAREDGGAAVQAQAAGGEPQQQKRDAAATPTPPAASAAGMGRPAVSGCSDVEPFEVAASDEYAVDAASATASAAAKDVAPSGGAGRGYADALAACGSHWDTFQVAVVEARRGARDADARAAAIVAAAKHAGHEETEHAAPAERTVLKALRGAASAAASTSRAEAVLDAVRTEAPLVPGAHPTLRNALYAALEAELGTPDVHGAVAFVAVSLEEASGASAPPPPLLLLSLGVNALLAAAEYPFPARVLTALSRPVPTAEALQAIFTALAARWRRLLDAAEHEGDCVVCLEGGKSSRLACCGAVVHAHCLTRWLARQSTCPHCRVATDGRHAAQLLRLGPLETQQPQQQQNGPRGAAARSGIVLCGTCLTNPGSGRCDFGLCRGCCTGCRAHPRLPTRYARDRHTERAGTVFENAQPAAAAAPRVAGGCASCSRQPARRCGQHMCRRCCVQSGTGACEFHRGQAAARVAGPAALAAASSGAAAPAPNRAALHAQQEAQRQRLRAIESVIMDAACAACGEYAHPDCIHGLCEDCCAVLPEHCPAHSA